MDFDNQNQLVNHKLKFCVHSKNLDRLDQKLDQLAQIERDVDSQISRRSQPKPVQTIRNTGREIVGLKPPSSHSDRNLIVQEERDYVGGSIKHLE